MSTTNVIALPRTSETERVLANGVLAEHGLPLITREQWRAWGPIADVLRRRALRKGGDDVG